MFTIPQLLTKVFFLQNSISQIILNFFSFVEDFCSVWQQHIIQLTDKTVHTLCDREHFTLQSAHWKVNSKHCTLHAAHCTLYTAQCMVSTVDCCVLLRARCPRQFNKGGNLHNCQLFPDTGHYVTDRHQHTLHCPVVPREDGKNGKKNPYNK